MSDKITKIGVVVALVFGLVAMFVAFGNPSENFAGLYNTNPTQFINGFSAGTASQFSVNSDGEVSSLVVGTDGSAVTEMLKGTCSLVSDSSIAATSTGTGTCAISGLVAGDKVFVSLATTTTKIAAQWAIIGTVAGTDSATVRLLNQTGTAAVPAATYGFGSSTQYWVVR
jgi:hypothetical protein